VSGATAVRAVEAAHRRGWIEKVRDPQDRRVVWLHTTERGLLEREALRHQMADHLLQLLASLTPPDREQFVALLSRLVTGERA
jgi:DNA-binding MarR family transcriptional regulator